jgi:hypothetical protein
MILIIVTVSRVLIVQHAAVIQAGLFSERKKKAGIAD